MNSEKNEFRIIKYRLKVGNPNILLVQCWFSNNEMGDNKLLFLLDDKRLVPKISIKEGIEIRKRHLTDSYGIDREYYFWLPLPEAMNSRKYIRIFEEAEGKTRLVYAIPCRKIMKLRGRVESFIEESQAKDGKVEIKGWYIAKDRPVRIMAADEGGKPIEFDTEEMFRQDVVAEFPETAAEDAHGFKLILDDAGSKRVKIVLSDGKNRTEYDHEIYPSVVKKGVTEARKIKAKTVSYLKTEGVRRTARRAVVKLFRLNENNYMSWRKANGPTKDELDAQREARFDRMPKISIAVPLYKTPLSYLEELICSVREQTYGNWELCLSDGSGEENSALTEALKRYQESDRRIKTVISPVPLKISENTNEALRVSTGDYIAFADHDDLLTPDALYECVKALNEDPKIDALYSDEDKISMNGKEYFEPHFKTDFNIDLLCSMNYICHLFVVSRKIMDQVGMLRSEFDGAQDYDFVLRSVEAAGSVHHIPKVLYHWRAHKDSTSENPQSKMYAFEAGKRAVQAHYDRIGIAAKVHQGEYLGLYKTEHILKEHPLISLIIPNKDHIEDLDKCISSIEQKSTYDNYEYIIVENNSENEETFRYYKDLEKENPRVHVVCWEGEFNYSAINNYGAKFAKGEYLLLLNNDTEIINGSCLEEMIGYCMHDNVGAVGARLYYSDETIQHAGVIVGFGGIAGHAFIGLPRSANGYFSRIICAQDMSAVTAACMMVKKSVFEEVGGLSTELQVAFNDIDLCMKIREAGYLIVYNPYAELYHYESKSRGLENTKEKVDRFNGEIATFAQKWPEILKNGDPYYNPNLSLERCDFSLK